MGKGVSLLGTLCGFLFGFAAASAQASLNVGAESAPPTQADRISDLYVQPLNPSAPRSTALSYSVPVKKYASNVNSIAAAYESSAAPATPLQFKQGIALQAGQDRVDQRGQLLSNTQANARTASLFDASGRYRVQMFGAQSEPTVDYNGLAVTYSPAKYTSGASVKLNAWNHWQVESDYFNSTSSTTDPTHKLNGYDAKTWNVAANRSWRKNSISTRLEYARSQFHQDEFLNDQADEKTDSAIDSRLNISSKGLFELPGLDRWAAGLLYQSVGNDFHNMGTVQLPNGLQQTHMFFQTAVDHVAFELDWRAEEQSRYDELALVARETQRSGVTMIFTPEVSDANWLWRIIGDPTLTTRYSEANQQLPEYIAEGKRRPLLSEIEEVGMTLRFARDFWHWSVQYQETDQNDRLADMTIDNQSGGFIVSDWDRAFTQLEVGFKPADRLSLKMNMQWHEQYEIAKANDFNQRNYGLEARFDVIPNICSFAMQYNLGRNTNELHAVDAIDGNFASNFGNAELSWHAARVSGARPAMDVYLKSSYGKFEDRVAADVNEQWSAHLGVKLFWARRDAL